MRLKGRAWIATDTYQVVQLETDLAKEIPAIRLRTEHLTVEYGPVQFQKRSVELWLPESGELVVAGELFAAFQRKSFGTALL